MCRRNKPESERRRSLGSLLLSSSDVYIYLGAAKRNRNIHEGNASAHANWKHRNDQFPNLDEINGQAQTFSMQMNWHFLGSHFFCSCRIIYCQNFYYIAKGFSFLPKNYKPNSALRVFYFFDQACSKYIRSSWVELATWYTCTGKICSIFWNMIPAKILLNKEMIKVPLNQKIQQSGNVSHLYFFTKYICSVPRQQKGIFSTSINNLITTEVHNTPEKTLLSSISKSIILLLSLALAEVRAIGADCVWRRKSLLQISIHQSVWLHII